MCTLLEANQMGERGIAHAQNKPLLVRAPIRSPANKIPVPRQLAAGGTPRRIQLGRSKCGTEQGGDRSTSWIKTACTKSHASQHSVYARLRHAARTMEEEAPIIRIEDPPPSACMQVGPRAGRVDRSGRPASAFACASCGH